MITYIPYMLWTLLLTITSSTTIPLSYQQQYRAKPQATDKQQFDNTVYHWSKIMAETCSLLKNKYYETPKEVEQAFINGLKAITHTLDPHSSFFDAKEYEAIKESLKGELCGIGVIIDYTKEKDDEFIRIIDTIPQGPADKAGVKADDKIIQIDDDVVKGITLDEAIRKIKGKKGTPVTIRIQRSDTTKHIILNITRDTVVEPNALCYEFVDQKIYYMCLNTFSSNSVGQMKKIITEILKFKGNGLILDLRNNTGGLVNAVVDIAELFLPQNSLIVSTQSSNNNTLKKEYRTAKQPLFKQLTLPIFILVNNYTASAAEILAGCLQIYAQDNQLNAPIFVVGSKTFGKGTMQEVIPLGNDSTCDCAIKLTIGLYLLPDGKSIQASGVIPDFEIEPLVKVSEEVMWFNEHFGRESALKNAIKADQEKNNPQAAQMGKNKKEHEKKDIKSMSWHERKQELIRNDYIILSTIRLISFLHCIRQATPAIYQSHTKTKEALSKSFALEKELSLRRIATE